MDNNESFLELDSFTAVSIDVTLINIKLLFFLNNLIN